MFAVDKKNFFTSVGLNNQETAWIIRQISCGREVIFISSLTGMNHSFCQEVIRVNLQSMVLNR